MNTKGKEGKKMMRWGTKASKQRKWEMRKERGVAEKLHRERRMGTVHYTFLW